MLGIESLVDTSGCSNLKQDEHCNASKQSHKLITNLNVAVGKNCQCCFRLQNQSISPRSSNCVTNPACSFKGDQKFGLSCTFLQPRQYESYADYNFLVVQMQWSIGSLQCLCLFHQLIKMQQRSCDIKAYKLNQNRNCTCLKCNVSHINLRPCTMHTVMLITHIIQ